MPVIADVDVDELRAILELNLVASLTAIQHPEQVAEAICELIASGDAVYVLVPVSQG